MIKLPLATDWNVCTPNLFRYLESEHVTQFFGDGSLRISSFAQFHKHKDEQRLDKNEGRTMFVHRTNQRGGQTITAWATHGVDAYILCMSMRHDKALMSAFNCDSYFRVNNSTGFGMAVARHIPGLVASFEGPCIYQEKKIIEQDLGYIDVNQFRLTDNPGQIDKAGVEAFIVSQMQHYPLFLKDKGFAHQVEYRYIWIVRNKEKDFLDLKVPEAVQFCEKPNELTE